MRSRCFHCVTATSLIAYGGGTEKRVRRVSRAMRGGRRSKASTSGLNPSLRKQEWRALQTARNRYTAHRVAANVPSTAARKSRSNAMGQSQEMGQKGEQRRTKLSSD